MTRYVFPPNMDFLKYLDITPFAMYIFEFEYEFDQDDLSYMWQNLAPVRTGDHRSFKTAEASVAHELLNTELMGLSRKETGKNLQDKVQWMVFKVKQKAMTNFSNLSSDGRIETQTETTSVMTQYGYGAGAGSAAEGGVEQQDIEYQVPVDPEPRSDYSYNWPYDFFSFVELVKIESQVLFGGRLTSQDTPLLDTTLQTEVSRDAGRTAQAQARSRQRSRQSTAREIAENRGAGGLTTKGGY
jgi:hypothetical protein